MNIKNLGLEELTVEESKNTNGGGAALVIVGLIIVGLILSTQNVY